MAVSTLSSSLQASQQFSPELLKLWLVDIPLPWDWSGWQHA
jgi:hypothetical protein